MRFPTWKDGPVGLLESGTARDTVLELGDASRGALYLALRPAASNGESPSPPPPERRAIPHRGTTGSPMRPLLSRRFRGSPRSTCRPCAWRRTVLALLASRPAKPGPGAG